MSESVFDVINELIGETDKIGKSEDIIENVTDATRFIESYVIELIDFYNERYKEYKKLEFDNIKIYLKHLRIRNNFVIEVKPLTRAETIEIISDKDKNLAMLIKDTDLSNRLSFPLDVSADNLYEKPDYLSKSFEDAMNIQDIKALCESSINLFVIPPTEDFIKIFFVKKKLLFMNYFEFTNVNPLNSKTAKFIGEDKEIYRKAEVLPPEVAISIDNLALYHNKTKKRSIDVLIEVYKEFYEFIINSANYVKIRQNFYQYAKKTYPALCI